MFGRRLFPSVPALFVIVWSGVLAQLRDLDDDSVATRATLPSGHPFSGVQPYYYWPSTTFAADSRWLAWLPQGDVNTDCEVDPGFV